jgi:alpha-L-fucosidase 2
MKITCLKLILVSCLVAMDLLVPAFSQVKQAGNTQPGNSLPATQRTSKITTDWTDRAQFIGMAAKPPGNTILWYRQSARVWEEALPLGNGRLGAMIFGGVADERIQLN